MRPASDSESLGSSITFAEPVRRKSPGRRLRSIASLLPGRALERAGFYWRTASSLEVDIVLEDRSGKIVGIEVKASTTLGSNDVRGLSASSAFKGT
jgi:hypothetical protein